MGRTQVNKATEHHLGLLRAKIAKLKREQETKSKKGSVSDGFDVRRAGDATVVLIGLPSVGKSTLLNKLTSAKSSVAAFQFTTITDVLVTELANIGIRLNQKPPNIIIEQSSIGGISIAQQVKLTKISEKLLKDILHVYGITSARVVIREDVESDQIVDFLSGSKTYADSLTLINKIDLVDDEFLNDLKSK